MVRAWAGSTDGSFEVIHSSTATRGGTLVVGAGWARLDGDPAGVTLSAPGSALRLPLRPVLPLLRAVDRVPWAQLLAARGWTGGPAWAPGPTVLSDDAPSLAEDPSGARVCSEGTHGLASLPAPLGAPRTRAPNPFVPGRPAPDAAARLRPRLFADLASLVESRNAVALVGPRRAGKTSLLLALAAHFSDRPVWRASAEGHTLRTRDDLARLLQPELPERGAADQLLGRLAAGADPVILLDEVGWLLGVDLVALGWLRRLGQERASLVLSATWREWRAVVTRAMDQPGSAFTNEFRILRVERLDPVAARAFVLANAPADAQLADVADDLVALSDGWPWYLQMLAFEAVQTQRAGSRLLTRGDVAELRRRTLLVDHAAAFVSMWADVPAELRSFVLDAVVGAAPGEDLAPLADLRAPPRVRRALQDADLASERGWTLDRVFTAWLAANLDYARELI